MTDELRVVLEVGPKGKKVVEVAPDWPGLVRGAKDGGLVVAAHRKTCPRACQQRRPRRLYRRLYGRPLGE